MQSRRSVSVSASLRMRGQSNAPLSLHASARMIGGIHSTPKST